MPLQGGVLLALFFTATCILNADESNGRVEIKDDMPQRFQTSCERAGRVEEVKYATSQGEKRALVYLPYGYDDSEKRYPVLYLMHGGGDAPELFFTKGSASAFSNILDRLVDEGLTEPVIVVAPSFYPASNNANRFEDAGKLTARFPEELRKELIPAIEGKYRTFANSTTDEDLRASRQFRAFGGFSMGAETTWRVFLSSLDYFSLFIPISGDCWVVELRGGQTASEKTAEILANSVAEQGFSANDFKIFALTGDADIAYEPLNSMLEAMSKKETFQFGTNIFYGLKKRGTHSHPDMRLYLYKALPVLFPKNQGDQGE